MDIAARTMNFDDPKIRESKEQRRRRLAQLPFAEKLRILDEMRERDLLLARKTKPPSSRATGKKHLGA